jgi:hypothetical protein
MGSRLDKNSKLPAGKGKGSSSGKAGSKSAEGRAAESKESSRSAKPAKAAAKAADAEAGSKKPADRRAPDDRRAPAAKRSTSASKPASSRAASAEGSKPAPARPAARKPATSRAAAKAETSPAENLSFEEFSIALIKPGETKERIWRTKSFHQLPVQREFGFPDTAPELPGHYHQDKLVLMPKDPEYMFCYWELTPGLIDDKSREKIPEGNYRETLKINWESKSLFEPNFTFIPVFFWARKWYFGVPQVGQRYQVELGWLSDTGHFISIIRSNLSELPESWAQTQKRLSEQGDVLAYSARSSKMLGSSEHLAVEDTRAFVPEWNLSSESFSSSSWSRAAGTGGLQGDAAAATAATPTKAEAPSAAKPAKAQAAKKPAVPKARLEISGKVLPGTTVTVGGKEVPIDNQGFFKTEFPYEQDTLKLRLTDREGASRSFAYDLKELVLT